ncbi:MAG: hypothetical protein SGILL_003714 [Bacillariaceae sp.]
MQRYLAMSEFLLRDENDFAQQMNLEVPQSSSAQSLRAPFFGAIYSSDKPQLITQGGMAPITPMLSKGDVGVLCFVQDWMDGMIPTKRSRESKRDDTGDDENAPLSGDTIDGTFRRRIRLNAVAVSRFRVISVLQDSPFILVEAEALTDDSSVEYDTQQMEGLEAELRRTLQKDDSPAQAASNGDAVTAFSTTNSLGAVDAICSVVNFDSDTQQHQRNELVSFLSVSTLTDGSSKVSPEDLTNVLQTQSLQNRMDILRYYKQW